MADKTLPTLTAATDLDAADLLLVRKDGETSDQKLTGTQLLTFVNSNAQLGATSQVTGLDAALGGKQASNAQLTDIAGLAVTDGNFIVGNGTTWVAESGATVRASLGLTIGTNVQAWDAKLDALTALTTSTGMLVRVNSAGTLTVRTVTAGSSKLTITNGSGVSGNPTIDLNTATANTWTGQQSFGAQSLTDGANIAWNLNTQQSANVTLGGNRTLDNPTNMVNGGTYILVVRQDGTGSRTLAFGSAYLFPGGTAPTLSTDANSVDILSFVSDGTNMFGVAQLDFS